MEQRMYLLSIFTSGLLLNGLSVVANTCNTTSNGVVIPDSVPEIEGRSIEKIYNTTVGLEPTRSDSEFNVDTFRNAALTYYRDISKTKLAGFLDLPPSSINETKQTNLVLVSYLVRYDLTELLMSEGINDSVVEDTIGNFDEVSFHISTVDSQFTTFFVFTDESDFRFQGTSMCNQIDCGVFMTCTENQDGVSLCCQSMCKSDFCQNNGTCVHQRQVVSPQCQCPSLQSGSQSLWYYGEVCESVMSEWMIILAVVLPIVAIIIVLIFSCCCYCTEYHKRKKRMLKQLKIEFAATDNFSFISNDNHPSNEQTFDQVEPEKEKNTLYVNWNPELREYHDPPQYEVVQTQRDIVSSSSSSSSSSNESVTEAIDTNYDLWSLENQKAEDLSPKDLEEKQKSETIPKNLSESVGKTDIRLRAGWTPSIGPQLLNAQNSTALSGDSYL